MTILPRSLVAVALVLTLTACSKNDSPPAPTPVATTSRTAGTAETAEAAATELLQFLGNLDSRSALMTLYRVNAGKQLRDLKSGSDASPEEQEKINQKRAEYEAQQRDPGPAVDRDMHAAPERERQFVRLVRHEVTEPTNPAQMFTGSAVWIIGQGDNSGGREATVKFLYYKGVGWKYDSITGAVERGSSTGHVQPVTLELFDIMMRDAFGGR